MKFRKIENIIWIFERCSAFEKKIFLKNFFSGLYYFSDHPNCQFLGLCYVTYNFSEFFFGCATVKKNNERICFFFEVKFIV